MARLTSELLRPLDAAQAIDEAVLLRYVAAHVAGFPSPALGFVLTQFGYGQSNPTYCLEVSAPGGEARRYVLRKKPPDVILQSAHVVEREFQVGFLRFARSNLMCFRKGEKLSLTLIDEDFEPEVVKSRELSELF
ncbi:hypothetical protein GUJ93_ZPchr0006g44355 [Zizania palustris]|uniref:Uncharacterized protein n=1 Tax=Zizania palustris TaxID=103762 RepID=A0A8J5W456_ZIZPA|nr:hypothetical protein GUJ93_ZPchr0006g44355 [Zizania palustris]